jgi:hypothetical protein
MLSLGGPTFKNNNLSAVDNYDKYYSRVVSIINKAIF